MPTPKPRPSKLPPPPRPFEAFRSDHPAVAEAYGALGEATRRAGPLTEREIALVKLGISIGARLEGAAHAHTRKAVAVGIEPEALRHVAILAAPTLGLPTMMAAIGWVDETILGKKRRKRAPAR